VPWRRRRRKRLPRAIRVVALAGVACALAGAIGEAKAAYPGSNGRLLFIRFEGGFTYAYTSRVDGGGARRIVKADFAAWSPNGRRLAFADADRGMVEIMSSTGGARERVYDGIDPTWSPEGNELALVAFPQRRAEIVLVRTDGRVGARQLTSGEGEKFQPVWSPDGRQIAYAVSYDGRNADDIFEVSPAGGEPRQLTSGPALDSEPSWSPDGRTLLVTRRTPGQSSHIFSLDLATNAVRQLTEDKRADASAVWSSDGRQIAFSRYVDGQTRLWLMNSDGNDERRIANSVTGDYLADWQRTIDLGVRQRVRQHGRQTRITITIVNRSPASATAVLIDRLPAGARLLAKPRTCHGGTRVVCRLAMLAANSSRTITLVVTPPDRRGANRVTILGTVVDPNTDDNITVASLSPSPPRRPGWTRSISSSFGAGRARGHIAGRRDGASAGSAMRSGIRRGRRTGRGSRSRS
jgi:Tol biopolymer transport system component